MRITKVFMSGNFQAIRLPKKYHFSCKKVAIEKKGNKLIIFEVPETLEKAYHLLASLPSDFFKEGRNNTLPQERESL